MDGSPKTRILKPFEGLDNIAFDMTLDEVQGILGIHESTVENKFLKQDKVVADQIEYVFENRLLINIRMTYQDGVYFNGVDIFNAPDVDALLQGYQVESEKDTQHIKELGLVLFKFRLKNRKKRALWFYSKAISPEYDNLLDVV